MSMEDPPGGDFSVLFSTLKHEFLTVTTKKMCVEKPQTYAMNELRHVLLFFFSEKSLLRTVLWGEKRKDSR